MGQGMFNSRERFYSDFQNKCPILLTFILLKLHIPISFATLLMKIGIIYSNHGGFKNPGSDQLY
jgi:hypothetical protein